MFPQNSMELSFIMSMAFLLLCSKLEQIKRRKQTLKQLDNTCHKPMIHTDTPAETEDERTGQNDVKKKKKETITIKNEQNSSNDDDDIDDNGNDDGDDYDKQHK